jgi:subtilisin family serine protease
MRRRIHDRLSRIGEPAHLGDASPKMYAGRPGRTGRRAQVQPAQLRPRRHPRFPYTSEDLTNVWQDFNITSNFATQIPCFVLTSPSGFPQGQCYTAIQGTSMATPHVVGAMALSASAHRGLRKHPAALIAWVKAHANSGLHNLTRALSATDTSGGDLTGGSCPTGYCHLSGPRISDADAYGAGLVNSARP